MKSGSSGKTTFCVKGIDPGRTCLAAGQKAQCFQEGLGTRARDLEVVCPVPRSHYGISHFRLPVPRPCRLPLAFGVGCAQTWADAEGEGLEDKAGLLRAGG